ncbi:MAG: DUF58 domain-containing protein [Planctomycetes bacterium]|nr:DUF58 domain-containing protein [Planctomycetota bacterium]
MTTDARYTERPLFDRDFLARCERLAGESRRKFGGRVLGYHGARQLAGGTEVTGYCDYAAGDDPRYVDWNRCARHDELVSKQFQGDEDLQMWLLVDCSASMALGGKFDYARRLAGALAYVGLANLSRVGAAAFSAGLTATLPPQRGKRSVRALLAAIESMSLQGEDTDLDRTARQLIGRQPRPALVIVLSDFYDPRGVGRGLDVWHSRGHHVHLVQIFDPSELKMNDLGDVELSHLEPASDQHVVLDRKKRQRYRELMDEFRRTVRRCCRERHFGCTQITTERPFDRQLLGMMHAASLDQSTPA